MPENRSFVLDFALKVFLPSVIAAAGISLLLANIFDDIFADSNSLDRAYGRRSVQSAILTLHNGMERLIQDNAAWDEAVDNIYLNHNPDWLRENWTVSDSQKLYDAAFVVDADGKSLFASLRKNPENSGKQTAEDYLGAEVKRMLAKLPSTGTKFASTAATLRSKDGVSIVGAGVIVPLSGGKTIPGQRTFRLLFAKTLDNGVLASLAKQFALDNLHFVDKQRKPAASVDIMGPAGEVLAAIAWNDRSPGSTLRSRYRDIVSAAISLFLLIVGVLVYICWRGFRQAHESRASAIAASMRDDLTGLANRRMLVAKLGELLAARKKGEQLSIVYADLDGFKEINDAYGHEIGDLLLKSAAAGFSFLAEGYDLVARLGGDEFAIVTSGSDATFKARKLAQSMVAFFKEPLVFGGRVASISVSAGIVDLVDEKIDVEEVLRRADVAMYAAKAAGRSRLQVYDAALDSKRNESRTIARELRAAIDEGKLGVVYQPVFDARTRQPIGVEALVRWPADSPRKITPDVFVPIAEEFGLIDDLGDLVLAEACRQAARWPNMFVAVNVSPIQFMNPGFAYSVEKTLRAAGLAAERLEIEVTEGFVIDNAERATAIINKLHDMRVSVALDDFGTGYSSIGHLRRFKFDKLKLDRSMVSDILRQPSALRLVQGTIAMADALGMRVTAEGIEDEDQVSVLRLAGCSQFQGFLFARPVPAQQIPAYLNGELAAKAS